MHTVAPVAPGVEVLKKMEREEGLTFYFSFEIDGDRPVNFPATQGVHTVLPEVECSIEVFPLGHLEHMQFL